jgi:prepilin-type N-terminal cleavage/methylation domain-containing protein
MIGMKARYTPGMTLIELVVVAAILAAIAGAVTFAVTSALKKERSKACLTNMLMIEAAKDEYARDHPGATEVVDPAEFVKYFRFGVPRCPENPNEDYVGWSDLRTRVSCRIHGTIENLQAVP